MRKDKTVAGILALFLGWAGVHRFYLGQVGMGIFYAILIGTGISFILAMIDAVAFFTMDPERFDKKYNRAARRMQNENPRDKRYQEWKERQDARRQPSQGRQTTARPGAVAKANPYKQSGVQKFKEYDYKGAIEEFEKALEIDERNIAIHFNLACAWSLEENAEKALFHLDKAVGYGFRDFDRIRKHDAFAYLRIQPEYAAFETNQFRLSNTARIEEKVEAGQSGAEDLLSTQPDLLDQLKKLGDLREKGLLTEEEFADQKRKLLG
jgi:TM2 domain-containing membrane protein YozV